MSDFPHRPVLTAIIYIKKLLITEKIITEETFVSADLLRELINRRRQSIFKEKEIIGLTGIPSRNSTIDIQNNIPDLFTV